MGKKWSTSVKKKIGMSQPNRLLPGTVRFDKTNCYTMEKVEDHPYFPGKTWVRQHRLRMAEKLGRALNRNETVHHKNGCRTDNCLENLELMELGSHSHLHNKGKIRTPEHKAKIAEAARKRTQTPQFRKYMSQFSRELHASGRSGKATWNADSMMVAKQKLKAYWSDEERRKSKKADMQKAVASLPKGEMSRRSHVFWDNIDDDRRDIVVRRQRVLASASRHRSLTDSEVAELAKSQEEGR